jgi:hypothetical protein
VEAGVFNFGTPLPPETGSTSHLATFENVDSPFVFGAGVLPPLVPGRPCFAEDAGFTVRVAGPDGGWLGGETFFTCSRQAVLADGCTASLSAGGGGQDGVGASRTSMRTVCITWGDRLPDETGFKIVLGYPNSGEKFEYTAPANTVEFIPPAADTEGIGAFIPARNRKDWDLRVFAITPRGEELVGAQLVQVQ